ncbi:MAG: leucine-rich repeat domain-containing protein [Bacteroidales bacterium]|nr:leucine-rich repeat domain-containing protein [Bacteroidales bacterium]
MKKILITILIALAALPSVYAQQVSVRIENLTYIINTDDHTAVLNKGQNTVGYLTIPKTITESGQEYTITSIADNAFEQQTQLKEVTILADITSIGDYAFSGCTELENISLPNSLISIGNGAFYECKTIEHISLPANLTEIGESAFENCEKLKSLTIPQGVIHLRKNVMKQCESLTSITFSPYTETIGEAAMRQCFLLTQLVLPTTVTSIGKEAFWGCPIANELTIGENVKTVGQEAFSQCQYLTKIYIESSTTDIGHWAFNIFYGANVKVVYVPDNSYDFYDSRKGDWSENEMVMVRKMSGSGNVITQDGFRYLITNKDAKYVKVIGYTTGAADEENITIPSSIVDGSTPYTVTGVATHAFYQHPKLKRITLPSTTTSIADNAFAGCTQLTSISLPTSIKSIGASFVKGCTSLTTLTIPSSVVFLGDSIAFGCTGLTKVIANCQATSIPQSSFEGCTKLAEITLPTTLATIGEKAFYNCAKLTKNIELPSSMKSIANKAFWGCSSLAEINLKAQSTTLGSDVFEGLPVDFIIKVPASRMKSYRVAQNWSAYAEHIKADGAVDESELIDGLYYEITDYATHEVKLVGVESIDGSKVVIPDAVTIGTTEYLVTYIDANAFEGTSGITEIVVPETVQGISATAFDGIGTSVKIRVYESKYESIYKNDSNWAKYISLNMVDVIPAVAQFTLGGLKYTVVGSEKREVLISGYDSSMPADLVLNKTIKNGDKTYTLIGIDDKGLKNCDKLKSISLPSSVTTIGTEAFSGCSSLKEITIPENVTEISKNAFSGCSSLKTVNFNNKLTKIGEYTFANCVQLSKLTIPKSVVEIGKGAFSGCVRLQKVNIPDAVTKISDYTFQNCHALDSISFPTNLTSIGNGAFEECWAIKVVDIPKNVQSIGEKAFYKCQSLNLIVLYSENCTLGKQGFSEIASVYKIYVPESKLDYYKNAEHWVTYSNNMRPLKNDGKSFLLNGLFYRITDFDNNFVQVFSYETTITNLVIPDTVTFNDKKYAVKSIANNTFENCSVTKTITLPKTIEYIGKSAFYNCAKLTTINLPEKITKIEPYTFAECSKLRTIEIPDGVTYIGEYAFANCESLTTANLPANLETINQGIFQGCHFLQKAEIPSKIESIAPYAFTDCSRMTILTFSENVTSIGDSAFADNNSLEDIEFPENLSSIGNYAFKGCGILKRAIVRGENTTLGVGSFDNCDKITIIYVPIDVLEQYKTAENWCEYKDIIRPLYFATVTTDYGCTANQRKDMLLDSTIVFTVTDGFELSVFVNGTDMTDQLVKDGNTYSLKIIELSSTSTVDAVTTIKNDGNNNYEIANKDQLYWFVEHVSKSGNQKANAKLVADIELNTNVIERVRDKKTDELEQWFPKHSNTNIQTAFEGNFNGNGHIISGLFLSDTTLTNGGLFQTLKGTVNNLAIKDSYVNTKSNAGLVCGTLNGTISGCYVQGATNGKTNIGGIVGIAESGKIENCLFEGTATGDSNIGTIAGTNKGTLSSILTYGVAQGKTQYGTICGANSGSLSNCRYFKEVTTTGAINNADDQANNAKSANYVEGASTQFSEAFSSDVWTAGHTITVSTMAELGMPYLTNFADLSEKKFEAEIRVDGYKKTYFSNTTFTNNGYLLITYGYNKKDTFQLTSPEVVMNIPDLTKPGKVTVTGSLYELDFSYNLQILQGPVAVSTVDANGIKVWGYGSTLYVENAGNKTISVYNLSGSLIRSEKQPSDRCQISLPKGFYLVKIGTSVWKISL